MTTRRSSSAKRSLVFNTANQYRTSLTEKASPASTDLLLTENSAQNHQKVYIQIGNIAGALDHDSLSGFVADEHINNDTLVWMGL